jgi:hypothetical protein
MEEAGDGEGDVADDLGVGAETRPAGEQAIGWGRVRAAAGVTRESCW